MWQWLAKWVIKNRLILLVSLAILTVAMGYFASQVKLSYEFSKAMPTDNPKYLDYQAFKQKFGDDGNILVIGIQTDSLFYINNFKAYKALELSLKQVEHVEDVLSVPGAVNLQKDSTSEKLNAVKIFPDLLNSQEQLDSAKDAFNNLPFYNRRLYNDVNHSYLMAVSINKDLLNSPGRTIVINEIRDVVNKFKEQTGIQTYTSGLPLVRTVVADRIQQEMKLFLVVSLSLSVLILLLLFRSISTTLLSLSVVLTGVIWTVGLIHLLGYKITLLTALIPSLVVVIGIPNCIYFLNKYHSTYRHSQNKNAALVTMVSKMGVVTLFCNIAAAIGFAVFALTNSAILKEFGVVAGLSIMVIFFISFIILPAVLSYLSPPSARELKYLDTKWILNILIALERWAFHHKKAILITTGIALLFSILGITRLQSVGYIVDDLPKTDIIYTDLKFFENNFNGVMPLEIVIDTKKKYGLTGMKALAVFEKIDSFSQFIASIPEMNKPLSVAEALKFAKQGFYEGDSTNYVLPNGFDGAFVVDYLRPAKNAEQTNLSRMMRSFMDSNRRATRISISMADVGTERLPFILDTLEKKANGFFDSSYQVTFTGTSISFLEGSRFIINGLKESIIWAFLLIALCMLYLFKSVRVLICSLIPNVVPLVITAGIMGWAGVPLKPSTVLVFSVALGIAVDITIRFLVNYKQVLPDNATVEEAVKNTIKQTGLSIIYTSLVLTAGFIIFCASSFGGTFALGWLTSVTLFTATLTNLVLLPVLLLLFMPTKSKKQVNGF